MRVTGITKLLFPSVGLTMRDLVNAIAVAMVEAAEGKNPEHRCCSLAETRGGF